MALDGDVLGRRLEQAIQGQFPPEEDGDVTPEMREYRDRLFKVMGRTIVNYIKQDAEVHRVRISGVKPGPSTRGQIGTGRIK